MARLNLTLSEKTDTELFRIRASLDREMRSRGLAYSVGERGEQLAVSHFRTTPGLPKLQQAPKGTKNVDALSREGDRFSIKTVRAAKKTGTVYPDGSDPEKQLFEFLLVVRLHEDWTLKSIHQFDWSTFVDLRSWDKRMNAWYVAISSRTLGRATAIVERTRNTDGN